MTVVVPPPADSDPAADRSAARRQMGENPAVGRLAWFDWRRQLLLCLVALLAVLVLLGLAFIYVLSARISASERLHDRAGSLLVATQELRAALSEADAAAAAGVFAHVELVADDDPAAEDRLTPEEHRKIYDAIKGSGVYSDNEDTYSDSIEKATRSILELHGLDPDPAFCAEDRAARRDEALHDETLHDETSRQPARHCPLTELAERIPEYTGLVERARANNRVGSLVGETYLTAASALMRDHILPETSGLVVEYGADVDTAYREATSGGDELLLSLAFGVAVFTLLAAQFFLVRRTNRILNPFLLAAGACVLASCILTAVEFGGHHDRLADAQESGYEPMALLAESKTRALHARADQNFSLILLGSTVPFDFDQRFDDTITGLGYGGEQGECTGRPDGSGEHRGSLVEALEALEALGPDSGPGDVRPGDIERAFCMWLDDRAEILELLDPSSASASGEEVRREEAFKRTLEDDAFRDFVGNTDRMLESSENSFNQNTGDALGSLWQLTWAALALLAAATAAVAVGFWQCIREYL